MGLKVIFVLVSILNSLVNSSRIIEAIDSNLLKNVLDPEECQRQITHLSSDAFLGLQFADAGIRIPKGLLTGNTIDFGNYHQCLGIKQQIEDMDIQGKFCLITVPLNQNIQLPIPFSQYQQSKNLASFTLDETVISKIKKSHLQRKQVLSLAGEGAHLELDRMAPDSQIAELALMLGMCVPRPCTTQQAMDSVLFNLTEIGFEFTEAYCRLPNDKPWSGADTAAVVIFSIIGLITLLSTCYDVRYRYVLKRDVKQVNTMYQSCSLYTNCKRIMTFNIGPGTITCMDGLRALSMTWVILGHTFMSEWFIANPLDSATWTLSANAMWVTASPMAVDTFFTLSGILVVYTTAGKVNGKRLLKGLHWFYLGRFMRIAPLLLVTMLLQASYLNRMTDGPFWQEVAVQADSCRKNWWLTLLNVQNLVVPLEMCIGHTWYVAIDFQCYIVSPIVLFWVLGNRRRDAWLALTGGLLAVLVASSIYIFNLNLPAGTLSPAVGPDVGADYMVKYYFHTLSRAAPFFVGFIFGYILHIYRKTKVQLSSASVLSVWVCIIGITGAKIYFWYKLKSAGIEWENQFVYNFMNSYMRPAWAVAVGLLIFMCVHGFGGPINWFLSLEIFQLPARLSYGMYLLHFPLMFSINSTTLGPVFFSVGLFTFKFLAHYVVSFIASFIFTVLVESPISTLYRQLTLSVQFKKPAVNQNKIDTATEDKEANISAATTK